MLHSWALLALVSREGGIWYPPKAAAPPLTLHLPLLPWQEVRCGPSLLPASVLASLRLSLWLLPREHHVYCVSETIRIRAVSFCRLLGLSFFSFFEFCTLKRRIVGTGATDSNCCFSSHHEHTAAGALGTVRPSRFTFISLKCPNFPTSCIIISKKIIRSAFSFVYSPCSLKRPIYT